MTAVRAGSGSTPADRLGASNPSTQASGPPTRAATAPPAPSPGSHRGGQCVVSSFWWHRHTAAAFMAGVSKSRSSDEMTWILRPFRRPVRTWTAFTSPRLTRCNTVWRETPNALRASAIVSHPVGGCSTNRARSSSLTRIRHGAPGVSCSPAMNPTASQRRMVEGTNPRISAALAIGTSSPSEQGPPVASWRGILR